MRNFLRQLLDALAHRGPGHTVPTRSETALRATLTDLADRYERMADNAVTDAAKQRAAQIEQAARDIRRILANGRLPAYLLTDAELDALTPAQQAQLVDEEYAS